jgi:hypothetical protein
MDIVGKARKLERRIARSVDVAVQEFVGRGVPSALEIVHAVIDCAERQVQEGGRGRRVFPFNRMTVHLLAGPRDHERRARYAALFDGPPSITERVREALTSAGCRVDGLTVIVAFAPKRSAQWIAQEFHVEFDRVAAVPGGATAGASSEPPRITLTVTNGKAAKRAYELRQARIDIGRRAEVLDARQKLIRKNDVAFAEDGPDANQSVSRRHAHIAYDEERREYRVCDDRSAHGTSVIRDGKTIPIPAGPRGVRLKAGDEILLGQARIKISM